MKDTTGELDEETIRRNIEKKFKKKPAKQQDVRFVGFRFFLPSFTRKFNVLYISCLSRCGHDAGETGAGNAMDANVEIAGPAVVCCMR